MPAAVAEREHVVAAGQVAIAAVKARRQSRVVSPESSVEWASEHAVVVTTQGRQRFTPFTYQTDFLTDPSSRRLVLKARQVGMSACIAIEALHTATSAPDRLVLMVSRNGQLAQQLVGYCRHTLAALPARFSPTHESLSELAWPNGSRIVSLPAAPGAGRGYPATDAYLDEFAHAAYADLIYDSIVPALAEHGRLTVLSTPNGRANLFFRLWQGLEGGDWSRQQIHWSDCPRYSDDWAQQQRQRMTRAAFAQEYDCDFASSGDAVFEPDDLAKCREGWNPAASERFVTAWDIGRRQDHSVGLTLAQEGETWHVVAFERVLEPYPNVQARIERRCADYPDVHVVESNGVGDPVIENLTVQVRPFVTTARSKLQAIQALQLLVQQGRLKWSAELHGQLERELALYQWDDRALVQDCVMAAAIAAAEAERPLLRADCW